MSVPGRIVRTHAMVRLGFEVNFVKFPNSQWPILNILAIKALQAFCICIL